VMGEGRASAGAAVSTTVTVKESVPVLPWASVAEQITVVLPRLKALPDAGVHVTATVPSTISVALAL